MSYEYSDFGETLAHGTSNFENEICYTGGIYDDTTALYYLNARYYEPVTGRFLTEDTYRGEIGNLEDWHLYAYCNNNPINYVDPSGHKPQKYIKKDITNELNRLIKTNANALKEKMQKALKENKKIWKLPKNTYYMFRGERYYRNDAIGNIHFGYVGAILFSRTVLCAGAGVYQVKSGNSKWRFAFTWGDDPYDTSMINKGYKYYKQDNKVDINFKDTIDRTINVRKA